MQPNWVPSPYEKVYLLFEDQGADGESFLSIHKTPDGAITAGNKFLEQAGGKEMFGSIEDHPRTPQGSLVYIQVHDLED